MSIEEKRHELFEKWALSVGVPITRAKQDYMFMNGVRVMAGEYFPDSMSEWRAFNAALDAVVLPAREDDADGDRFAQGFNCALEEIQATGLGLKVLS